tara:strand:+ start:773 stop:1078 length:306 start_codon:yes stop_codon:yes gene_type:complete
MKKFFSISLILFLILITAFIKNSTKRMEDEIFIVTEDIRSLEKNFENIKLEYDYLSSAEKLLEFQSIYFDDELKKKNIQNIQIINKTGKNLKVKELKFINE